MIVRECLQQGAAKLSEQKVEDAALESEILLRHVLGFDRVRLYQNPEQELLPPELNLFWDLINRRISGEPSAYIIDNKEFYGLDFYVQKGVLIPRPETEHLVDKALELSKRYPNPVIADIGTGSGAIAVSLASKIAQAKIYAIDISLDALMVADINCHKHNVNKKVALLNGNLLEPLPEKADIIAANLPYVRTEDVPAVRSEPELALDGGEDGLDVIRLLCGQVEEKINDGGHLLLEIGLGQRDAVIGLLKVIPCIKNIAIIPDLRGIDRIIHTAFR
ncbi:MAG: peptide chain release factor N(5)-glutamine methyltransferase [Dehalococcoidales bacterium]